MNIIDSNLKFETKLKKLNSPNMIVIHHCDHPTASVEDIHGWHKNRGWSGFGYHFLVTKDGNIYRGRPENSMGAHCKGYNNLSLGICVQGNFENEHVNPIQFESLIDLCKMLFNKYDIDIIKGHKELAPTRCPGKYFPLDELKHIFDSKSQNISVLTYKVLPGDTLWSISKSFNLTVLELMKLNDLKDSLIHPNQILKIR